MAYLSVHLAVSTQFLTPVDFKAFETSLNRFLLWLYPRKFRFARAFSALERLPSLPHVQPEPASSFQRFGHIRPFQ